jgi:hypothetical protein
MTVLLPCRSANLCFGKNILYAQHTIAGVGLTHSTRWWDWQEQNKAAVEGKVWKVTHCYARVYVLGSERPIYCEFVA